MAFGYRAVSSGDRDRSRRHAGFPGCWPQPQVQTAPVTPRPSASRSRRRGKRVIPIRRFSTPWRPPTPRPETLTRRSRRPSRRWRWRSSAIRRSLRRKSPVALTAIVRENRIANRSRPRDRYCLSMGTNNDRSPVQQPGFHLDSPSQWLNR